MNDHNWLRRVAEVANDQGFENYSWICDHVCHIPLRRGNNRSRRAANINENYSTTPVKYYRLQVDPSIQRRVSDAMTQDEEDDLLALSWPIVDKSDSIFNQHLHLPLLRMPAAEMIRLPVGNSSLLTNSC